MPERPMNQNEIELPGELPEDAPDGATTPVGPFDSAPLALAQDIDAPAFSQGLQLLRARYTTRTGFNFLVCDELARRGAPPNSANVLRYGRWGKSAHVAADVRAWYAQLARRLSSQHANVPDVTRQAFNTLGEQMWLLAQDHVGQPMRDRLVELQARMDEQKVALEDQCAALERRNEELDRQNQERTAQAAEREGTLERAIEQRATENANLTGRIQTLEAELHRARAAFEQARRDHETQMAGQLERLTAQKAASETEKIALEQAHAQIIRQMEAASARLDAQFDALRKDSAIQIDRARQDAKAADARAEAEQKRLAAVRGEAEAAREQLIGAKVELAHAQRENEGLRERATQMQAEVERQKALIAAAAATALDVPEAKKRSKP